MSKLTPGVHPSANGFFWSCGCGETSSPVESRDACRDSYKAHRQEICIRDSETPKSVQEDTPKEAVSTMTLLKEKAKTAVKKPAKKGAAAKEVRVRETAVSEAEARKVAATLEKGTGTVMGEARRLGVYHATLRKALRKALGAKEYAKLMSAKKGRPTDGVAKKPAAKSAAKKTAPKKGAKKVPKKKAPAPAAHEDEPKTFGEMGSEGDNAGDVELLQE